MTPKQQAPSQDATQLPPQAPQAELGSGLPPPLRLTAAALAQMRLALATEAAAGQGIRLAVVGGGCAGFQYSMNFESTARPGDTHFDQEGLPIYVDKMSISYLMGCEVDWVSSPMGAGFKFINPNVTTTCGCGSSFA